MTSAQNGSKTAISLWHSPLNWPRKIPPWIHCVAFTYVATTYNSYKYLSCVASVSVRFRSKERGARVTRPCEKCWSKRARRGWGRVLRSPPPPPSFIFLALVPFFAWSKPKIPFLGLSLLRNQTETLSTQANKCITVLLNFNFILKVNELSNLCKFHQLYALF